MKRKRRFLALPALERAKDNPCPHCMSRGRSIPRPCKNQPSYDCECCGHCRATCDAGSHPTHVPGQCDQYRTHGCQGAGPTRPMTCINTNGACGCCDACRRLCKEKDWAERNQPSPLPKCERCLGEGEPDHTCPYAEDINGDSETLCNCCATCANECAMDI